MFGSKDGLFTLFGGKGRSDDVRISRVGDGHGADSEVFTASSTKINVVSVVVVDSTVGKHGVVFNFRLSEWWGVVGDKDHLG